MRRRNPQDPHRTKSWQNTDKRIEQLRGKVALLETWEKMPDEVQIANHDYLVKLRASVRQVKMYILHRASPDAHIF